jgi:sigma-B regulation protein RsbQ
MHGMHACKKASSPGLDLQFCPVQGARSLGCSFQKPEVGPFAASLGRINVFVAGISMNLQQRNNIHVQGDGKQTIIFAHGFGCDQNMWRFMAPRFADRFRVVTLDLVGAGGSDLRAYDRSKYESLQGYADDLIEIACEYGIGPVQFVGHSVSAIMGVPDRPELGAELTASFCRTDPEIAKQFAKVTFMSDNRKDLANFRTPTLIIQSSDDLIAPVAVGEYMHRALPHSMLRVVTNIGHCPHLSAPSESSAAMDEFLATLAQS